MRLLLIFSVHLLVLVGGCGGGAEPAGPPAALTAVTPGPFAGTVGTALAELRVRVEDASSRGVPGVAVRFSVAGGSGSLGVGAIGGSSLTDTTDQDGLAAASWTLGTTAGEQRATAQTTGLASVEFLAAAQAGAPVTTEIQESSAFIAPVSSPTDEPLAVRVTDAYGNPVAGVPVSWAALAAGATVTTPTTTSDSAGIATVGAALGSAPGLYLFRATPLNLGPDTIAVLAVTVVLDPVGDQTPVVDPAFATHDVTRFGALVIQDVLVLYAKFAGTIGRNPAGQPTRQAVIANYDLDLDGDTLTGYRTLRECLGGPPLNFGADAFVDLDPTSGFLVGQTGVPPGAVAVLRVDSLLGADRCDASFNGALYAAVPAYQPTSVSIAVPLAFLRDEGAFAVTTLFAHPATGVTDVVPDSLAWEFLPTVAAGAPRVAGPANVWDYLPIPRPTGAPVRVEGVPPRRLHAR